MKVRQYPDDLHLILCHHVNQLLLYSFVNHVNQLIPVITLLQLFWDF
jgi:hypothetical protein